MSLASILADLKGLKDYYDPAADHEVLQGHLRSLALAAALGVRQAPSLKWLSTTTVQVQASGDTPVGVMLLGFPNILHPGLFIDAGLSDGWYREITAAASLDLSSTGGRWGTEKANQWYAVYALAGAAETAFTLKAMPFMRFSSQAAQVITLRHNKDNGDIGYGLAADELAGGKIYVLSGVSGGLLRTITANNTNNDTGGTITYSGTALSLSRGDWFIVLPPGANFRWIGDFFNDASQHVQAFLQLGDWVLWLVNPLNLDNFMGPVEENINALSPLATLLQLNTDGSVGHPDLSANILGANALTAVAVCKTRFSGCSYAVAFSYAYPSGLR